MLHGEGVSESKRRLYSVPPYDGPQRTLRAIRANPMPRERHVTFRTDTAKHEARGHAIRSYALDWLLRLVASVAVHHKLETGSVSNHATAKKRAPRTGTLFEARRVATMRSTLAWKKHRRCSWGRTPSVVVYGDAGLAFSPSQCLIFVWPLQSP